uniref:YoaK family protein n=1 Tax=Thaumasiovibrio occultus TaxID=1891184 RepID=UPI00131DAD7C|nr:YoaK family protein [Thaumasiovibrio occultus]
MLAFSAGAINSMALLTFANSAVSHVTGTITQAMNAITQENTATAFYLLSIVASFFFGAVTSGMIIHNEALRLGRSYGSALLLEAIVLFAATYYFYHHKITGELLASYACGLQNAMIATYSGSVIRTTHLTGIVSDLGAALGHMISRRSLNPPQLIMQGSILVAFSAGAFAGAKLLKAVGLVAMALPATIVLSASIGYMLMLRRQIKLR